MPQRPATRPEVRIFEQADAAHEAALAELRQLGNGPQPALVSFATGNTYTAMLRRLHEEMQGGRVRLDRLIATHLDEYCGFTADQRGGMVHELISTCPSFGAMLQRRTFVPVPSDGHEASLAGHERELQRLGGVQLQLLGIGRNGHLAFNEPGTPFESGFHVTALAPTTREDARARFTPLEVPTAAVTAGIATILAARRLVLCAFGSGKAAAVRAMLLGEVSPQCPASAIRLHGNAVVLLDRQAAAQLDAAAAGAMG